ncbi:ferredoxin reductase [Terrabacter sp. MAHUQ-38]|uniref:ferredoxin reductase n=1 Tax=unclassified Terrabacter TaxID=2630222 RepID=UPI00165E03E1|nr:ferredoxin reductase [Terrabacter sp. MAHUQ-38]MBC9821104.1 ferredoxin reductase [Terrabacter sp. MAHUQ-38]
MSLTAPSTRAARPSLRRRLVQLAERATSPLLPADYLDLFDPLRPGADLRGRIVEVHPETADAATIVIRPGADWAGHVPGQYVRIGVDVDGVRQWRAYSLTHGPRPDGHISITVKAVPDGLVSTHLVRESRPGTLVHLEQAQGEFVLPGDGGRFLFVTAGSGVTPVIGMLRNLFPVADAGVVRLPRSAAYDIVVVHVAPSAPDSIFIDNLRALDAAGLIRLVARYDDEHGVLDVEHLDELVPDLHERQTLACGPGGLLDALERHHQARGLQLLTEQFRATTLVVGEGGKVAFSGSGATVAADGGTPILDAAEAAGVLMPSGCRMGICFGCVLPLREGAVRDLRTGAVTTATPGETEGRGVPIQTCISAAAGACVIDH